MKVGFVEALTYSVRTLFWRPVHSLIFLAVVAAGYIGYYSFARSDAGHAYFARYADGALNIMTGGAGDFFAILGTMMLVGLLSGAIIVAGAHRILVRETVNPIFPIQIGTDEFRILGLYLLIGLIMLGVILGFSILLVILTMIGTSLWLAMNAGDINPANATTFGAVISIFVLYVPMLYIGGRLAVSFPLSIRDRKFSLGGWKASRGQGVTLLFAHIVLYAVMMAIQFLLAPELITMSLSSMSGQPVTDPDALTRTMTDPFGELYWAVALVQAVFFFLLLGPTAAVAKKAESATAGDSPAQS